jgi:hypothetical protein
MICSPSRRGNPFWRGSLLTVFLLEVVLCGGLTLAGSPFQQESKPEKSTDQFESEKQAKKEERAEAASRLPAVLWRDPGAIALRDLLNGQGGANDAPDPRADYTFIREDRNGSSPKFYAQDSNGVKWLVKLGVEARTETAATRFVWAMGYYTDEDYFLPQIHVRNLPKLHRKIRKDLRKGEIVRNVRLKRQSKDEKFENWDWFNNPFLGTRELNGLRVLMALINNWDLVTHNNKVYLTENERRFVVSDLGAAFGKTGWPPSHVPLMPHATKGVLKDYEHSKFIRAVKGGAVTFEMRTSAPGLVRKFRKEYFDEYRQVERLERSIPIADAEWIGDLLAQLTPQQIRDAFRAAGYEPAEVEGYAKVVEKRIAMLKRCVKFSV